MTITGADVISQATEDARELRRRLASARTGLQQWIRHVDAYLALDTECSAALTEALKAVEAAQAVWESVDRACVETLALVARSIGCELDTL